MTNALPLSWDEAKRVQTLRSRDLDFAHMAAFDWDNALSVEDARFDYPETRYVSVGRLPVEHKADPLVVCVWCYHTTKGSVMSKPLTDRDGEARELAAEFFRKARRGRPKLPEDKRKQRVTMYLDPDVVARLRAPGRGWQTRANALLRRALLDR